MKTKKTKQPDRDIEFSMFYSFESPLVSIDADRYITTYNIEIAILNDFGERTKTIGKAEFKILLLGLAANNDCPFFNVFDCNEYTLRIGESIYDFNEYNVNEDILEALGIMLSDCDLGLITRLEILPDYRGKGLGKKVVKDIYNRFCNSCGLFIVETFPLQFEKSNRTDDEWTKKMQYHSLDKDFEKSDYQIKAFYQSIGFLYIEAYPEFMFLPTEFLNGKLDAIILD